MKECVSNDVDSLYPRYPVALKSTRHVWDKDTDIPLPYRKGETFLLDL